ncbi:MAG TPA: EAL domain-containing protein [Candidatus Baltobacteraceae bacterium]
MAGYTVSLFDLPCPAWFYDRETLRFLAVNDAAIERYGYTREEFLAMTLLDIRPAEDRAKTERAIRSRSLDPKVAGPWRHLTKSGDVLLVEAIATTGDFEGRATRAVVAIDATKRVLAEQALRDSEQRMSEAQETAHLGTWRRDLRTDEATWSDELCRIFGVTPEQVRNPALRRRLLLTHPDDSALVNRTLAAAQAGDGTYRLDHRIVRADDVVRWVHVQGRYEFDDAGTPVMLIGTLLDITERKAAEAALDFFARHDRLTGLHNRGSAESELERLLGRATPESLVVLFIDFDGFKSINETLGHGAGDDVLRESAQRLKSAVTAGTMVARWGGNEFLIIAPEIGGVAAASALARGLLQTLEDPYELHGRLLHTRPSIGISIYPEHGPSANELIRNADTAMFAAKSRKTAFEVFDRPMHAAARERLELENGLRAALKASEFLLVFQPIVDVVTGGVLAAEALVRWRHPERGILAPGSFMDVAEETGLIVAIDEFVLRQACAAARAWSLAGMAIPVAVNVSARDFEQGDIVTTVERAIRASGLLPEMLELELTESGVMLNVGNAIEIMTRLRSLGVRLAMDDFGTGYSSLSHLKRFPLDTLKIDRSFIADLPGNPFDRAITKAIVQLGNSAGLHVVAEGIEGIEQFDAVRELGCLAVQGYYLARPMPEADLLAFARERRAATLNLPPVL